MRGGLDAKSAGKRYSVRQLHDIGLGPANI